MFSSAIHFIKQASMTAYITSRFFVKQIDTSDKAILTKESNECVS